jgi:regulation of enolase protein 1 (concanavalin A-like superfamily)
MEWFNSPASFDIQYSDDPIAVRSFERLKVHAEPHTGFWRKTHFNFISDNGHFLYNTISGDFEVSVAVVGKCTTLYDQGGLMVRENPENWIKICKENFAGAQIIATVVTKDYSDLSTLSLPSEDAPEVVYFKLVMKQGSFEIFHSLNGTDFTLNRLGFLPSNSELQVGIMCASPDSDEGFDVEFRDFKLKKLE